MITQIFLVSKGKKHIPYDKSQCYLAPVSE